MAEEKGKKSHYQAIDGLRAFSAVGIVLMHVLANGKYALDGFVFETLIPSFTNLVFLFMVISGFAMCCGYYEKITNNEITIQEFYSKRYKKVWPYFALLCALDFVMAPSLNSLYETFANLTLCFGLLPDANITVIGVGWFLGLFFVFYFLFPFFCYLLSNTKRAWGAFACALVFNVLCDIRFDTGRSNIIYSAAFFLVGGLIFLYKERLEYVARKYKAVVIVFCLIALIGYFLVGEYVLLTLCLFALLLIYALGVSTEGILQNPITIFLSDISMEIYLCHMVIYRLLEKLHMVHLFKADLLSYISTSVLTVAGAIVFAVVTKKGLQLIEQVIREKLNN